MHYSISPSQKGWLPSSQRELSPINLVVFGARSELSQLREHRVGRRPGLARLLPLAPVEASRHEAAAGPLPIFVLVGEELGAPSFRFDIAPLLGPFWLWRAEKIAHHLPADGRIGLHKPAYCLGIGSHHIVVGKLLSPSQ